VAAREVAADVPELLQVMSLRALGGLHAERSVAALTAAAGLVVGVLHRVRQVEEGLRVLQRPRQQRLVQAVIGNDREPEALERGAKVAREARRSPRGSGSSTRGHCRGEGRRGDQSGTLCVGVEVNGG
jgi:hypothetical protein